MRPPLPGFGLLAAVLVALAGPSAAAAAPVPVRVCAEDREWPRPGPDEMARTAWRDNRYADGATGTPLPHALAYYTHHFFFFTTPSPSGAEHVLDMTGLATATDLVTAGPRGLCGAGGVPSADLQRSDLIAGRTVAVWVLGYRVLSADRTGDALTLTVEPNATTDRGYAVVEVARPPAAAWTARAVLADGQEVARTADPTRAICCADEPGLVPPLPSGTGAAAATLDRFMGARLERRGVDVLDLMTGEARAAVAGQPGGVHLLLQVSNPCWYRYEVVAFALSSPTRAAARVRIYQHQWMGDVGGTPPQSWEQDVELAQTPDGWRVSRLGHAGPRRDDLAEPHGPTTSACIVGHRPPVWAPTSLPATGGLPAASLPAAVLSGAGLAAAGVLLRRRRRRTGGWCAWTGRRDEPQNEERSS